VLVATGTGRAILAWRDSREGPQYVYALELAGAGPNLSAPGGLKARFALAPRANPTRGAIEMTLDSGEAGSVRVAVYDLSGRLVDERTVEGPMRGAVVRLGVARPGLYFAVAERAGQRVSRRVTVLE
jgi:hypothetical protein